MHSEIAISGSGGQGVLVIGRLLAEAGLLEGREVVWLPTYGAEKRGGIVSCGVTISDEKIGALFVSRPSAAIAMNQASAEKMEPVMKPRGVLVVNRSLAQIKIKRGDIQVTYVQANDLAREAGGDAVSNLVALGALMVALPIVEVSSLMKVLEGMFAKKAAQLAMNKRAFIKGYAFRNPEE